MNLNWYILLEMVLNFVLVMCLMFLLVSWWSVFLMWSYCKGIFCFVWGNVVVIERIFFFSFWIFWFLCWNGWLVWVLLIINFLVIICDEKVFFLKLFKMLFMICYGLLFILFVWVLINMMGGWVVFILFILLGFWNEWIKFIYFMRWLSLELF